MFWVFVFSNYVELNFFFNFNAATYSVHILDRVDLFGPFTHIF